MCLAGYKVLAYDNIFKSDCLWGTDCPCVPLCWGNHFGSGVSPRPMQAPLAVPDSLVRLAAIWQHHQQGETFFLMDILGCRGWRIKPADLFGWTFVNVLEDGLTCQRRNYHLTQSCSQSLSGDLPLNCSVNKGQICCWTVIVTWLSTVQPIRGISPHLCPRNICFTPLLSRLWWLMCRHFFKSPVPRGAPWQLQGHFFSRGNSGTALSVCCDLLASDKSVSHLSRG